MRSWLFLALFAVLAALAVPSGASAETLDRILPQIRANHPGSLSDAEPWTDSDGRMHYRIKWMTPEGRIIFFDADARTGRYWSSGGGWHRDRDGDDGGDRGSRRNNWDGEDGGDRHRDHWNDGSDGGTWRGDGGDWHGDRHGGGDWHGDRHGGGDWHGGWRGGHGGGDNGGGHHHGR
jgi:hypothetical protein